MKKLKPALSVLGSVSMALTLASPALADIRQTNPESTVEMFKEDANAKKEDKNFLYGSDGKMGRLITEKIDMTNNDWDKDGISNDLEINGYKIEFNSQTGKKEAKAWDPEKDKRKPKFISNPMSANSDGDPFDDRYEVEKYDSNGSTDFNPIVSTLPNLQIGVKRIEVIPIATITDNNGGSISRGWEKSVATQHSFNIGVSGEGGAEGSATGPVPSGKASLNVGYGYSKTNTETESYTNNFDWSTAKTVDTAQAAKVRVHLEYKNVGTASAENVSPHFNIRLGNKIINTVKATQDRYKAKHLSTEKGGNNKVEVVIDSLEQQADANIFLSLDELKALEQGELLSVEVLPTSTMDVSMRQENGQFMNLGDIGNYVSDVNAATEQLETDIGNIPKYNVYTPKDESQPVLSYGEVFKLVNIHGRDADRVRYIVNKAKSNNQVSAVDVHSDRKTFVDLLDGKGNHSYLHKDAIHGAFEKIQEPKVVESSYDYKEEKLRATMLPGLFGVSNEITAETGYTPTKLVKSQNGGYIYESTNGAISHLRGFSPASALAFRFRDTRNLNASYFQHMKVKYNKEYENYMADESGELITEGTPYTLKTSGNPVLSYKGNDRWQYLASGGNYTYPINVIIERKGQPKPGQPIKKGEELHIKVQNSAYSGYEYLKLQNGYIHFDKKQNASTFKFNHRHSPGTLNYQREWNLQSDGNNIGLDKGKSGYVTYGKYVKTGLDLDKWSFVKAK
ncbi:binary toxin-like calcium binding domain-containing protein [Bacillus toyonensis]|uniref:binary toxin-like calcium binding domain-containing protein n=1 Tax=Bacillus toyonensis TaxID=155322 RepID=UPI002E2397A1|nr:hypothetical protein [Bacillus toyonensis]